MKIYLSILISFLLVSCNSSNDDTAEVTLPQLTTKEIKLDDNGLLKIGGKVTSNGGGNITRTGVVWSTNSNVNVDNNEGKEDIFSSTEDFDFTTAKVFLPNTTYYFKAFAENSKGLAYGNTISYKYGEIIQTLDPINITTVEATLTGKFIQPKDNLSYAGFAYSLSPNPTIADKTVQPIGVIGSSNYSILLSGLIRNTEYYIRAYTKIAGNYYYGEQKKIKTAGYFGPAGGIVAYDKGTTTDGWRYLEISNKDVGRNYATSPFVRFGAAWCNSPVNYLAGTSDKMGDGLSNTNFIISKIAGESAAKFCKQYTVNGFADWFLPSKEEALVILTSLSKGGMSLNAGLKTWSSSEVDAQQAFYVYPTGASASQKIGDNITYPVRRY